MGEKLCVKSHVFMYWGKMMLPPSPFKLKVRASWAEMSFQSKIHFNSFASFE